MWAALNQKLQALNIKKRFTDTKVPVVLSAISRNTKPSKEILMNAGDLHLAVLATASPPGITAQVPVNHEYTGNDGYFGDDHGVRGYDALAPEVRTSRMFNIIFADTVDQVPSMNWTRLKEHANLKEVVTLVVASGKPSQLFMAPVFHKMNLPYIRYRNVVEAVHEQLGRALDESMSSSESHGIREYTVRLDLTPQLPSPDSLLENKTAGMTVSPLQEMEERLSK